MADQVTYRGRLIAIDATRGKDVNAAASRVAEALRDRGLECAISRWDASGLFGELAAGRGDRNISMRTLSLVYAADLAFRLRWEIRPVLDAGGIVIAAPYVDTAATLASACGIDEQWVRDLLRFAPAPTWRARAEEKKLAKPWKRRIDRGYAEYVAALLEDSAPGGVAKSARRKMMTRLDEARHRKTFYLSNKGLAALIKDATGTRPGASSRSPSRPRSGRKSRARR